MRSRTNLLAFAVTLSAATAGQFGHPAPAHATMVPTMIQWQYCCERGQNHCCGNTWCAITERGCASG